MRSTRPAAIAGALAATALLAAPATAQTDGRAATQDSTQKRARQTPPALLAGAPNTDVSIPPIVNLDRPLLYTPGPRGTIWQTSGSDIYFNTGSVGIGTMAPTMPLTVGSSTATQSILSINSSVNGRGITGLATGVGAGANFGVFGISFAPGGTGVFGQGNHPSGANFGITGLTDSSSGVGVRGLASSTSGSPIAVLGQNDGANGWTGYFDGGGGVFIDKGTTSTIGTALEIEGGQIIFNEENGAAGFVNMGYVNQGTPTFFITSDPNIQIGITFGTNLRLNSTGVGINRSAAANDLEVAGDASKTSAGSWLANSDRRIKTGIQTLTGALDMLDRVRLVSFEYTDDYKARHPSVADRRYLNVIAQEFAQVFPEHVKGSGEYLPDGSEILQVDTYPLTIYSAAAVQELRGVVNEQETRIADLEAKVESLAQQRGAGYSAFAWPLVALAGVGIFAAARRKKGDDE